MVGLKNQRIGANQYRQAKVFGFINVDEPEKSSIDPEWSGIAVFVPAVHAGSAFLAASAFWNMAVICIEAPVITQTPTAIVDENYFFRCNRLSCVH